MREDVLILLNEREPLKGQMAAELEQQLIGQHLAVERLQPSPNAARVIQERSPRLLVLDYMLGDFGTALDILSAFGAKGSKPVPSILWTDEPSVHAAVSAMKLGALDYIRIDSPRAVQQVLQAINVCLKNDARKFSGQATAPFTGSQNLVYQAKNSRGCLVQAHSAATRNKGIIILLGDAGVGRNALANYIHQQRRHAGAYTELDLDIWTGEPASLLTAIKGQHTTALLSHSSTVMIDHVEFDTGDLLECFEGLSARPSVKDQHEQNTVLIIGTTSPETAGSWLRLVDAEVITIPSLHERQEDILPLVQQFRVEAGSFVTANDTGLTPDVICTLARLEWPGNIRQFRAALLEALTTPLHLLKGMTEELEQIISACSEPGQELGDEQRLLYAAIVAAKQRWMRFRNTDTSLPEPLAARDALDKAHGNLRIAANYLSTGVPQLKKTLGITSGKNLGKRR
jgi:two-component system, NtrC family, nitrogen regulation response regulator NtrX